MLADDVTLSSWTPVCPDIEHAFSGTFNGGGNIVTLQSFSAAALAGPNVGIFGYVSGESPQAKAGIRNVKIVSSVTAASTGPSGQAVGLIAGYAKNAVIREITLEGSFRLVSAYRVYSGGIIGYLKGGAAVRDSASGMAMTVDGGGAGAVYTYVGGFVGLFTEGGDIQECHNTGDVTGDCTPPQSQVFVGGIAGGSAYGFSAGYQGSIQDCSSTGNITAKAKHYWSWAGGIAGTIVGGGDGTLEKTTRIVRCWASGIVSVADSKSGWPYVGGIIGYNYYGALVSQCYFTGSVVSNGGDDYVGGIAGYNSKVNGRSSRIEDCWSSGAVSGYTNGGGIVGQNQVAAITQRCYSIASVSVSAEALGLGGIAGYSAKPAESSSVPEEDRGRGTVQNCFALNPSLTAPGGFERVYRVIGAGGGTLSGNMASSAMVITINGQPSANSDIGLNARDGATCQPKPAQSVYENLGWDFDNVWKMGSDGYPLLQWQQP